jgi:hypothetical protein
MNSLLDDEKEMGMVWAGRNALDGVRYVMVCCGGYSDFPSQVLRSCFLFLEVSASRVAFRQQKHHCPGMDRLTMVNHPASVSLTCVTPSYVQSLLLLPLDDRISASLRLSSSIQRVYHLHILAVP